MNRVDLIGNLGRDPEIRMSQSNTKIVNLNLATNERWRNKSTGEYETRTEWHRVVIFGGGLADIAERFMKKGSRVRICGKLQTRKWQDQSGQDRYTTEVIIPTYGGEIELMDRPGDRDEADDTREPAASRSNGRRSTPLPAGFDDDEIPF